MVDSVFSYPLRQRTGLNYLIESRFQFPIFLVNAQAISAGAPGTIQRVGLRFQILTLFTRLTEFGELNIGFFRRV